MILEAKRQKITRKKKMSRVEIPRLVEEKLKRQSKPDAIGTLKRVDCELSNLLDYGDHDLALGEDWWETLGDLRKQVREAIG